MATMKTCYQSCCGDYDGGGGGGGGGGSGDNADDTVDIMITWLAIPAPANAFLKQEGLQLAEAGFRD